MHTVGFAGSASCMRGFVAFSTAFVLWGLSARAEIIDLNGASRTISSASELNADGYVNSSEAEAELVLDVAESMTLPATVSGKIKLVKRGEGRVTVPSALTYTGGTEIHAGFLQVSSPDWLGTVDAATKITVRGGGLELGAAASGSKLERGFVVAEGCTGTIRTNPSATAWTLRLTDIVFKNATLRLQSVDPTATAQARYFFSRGSACTASFAGTGGAIGGTLEVGKQVFVDLSAGDVLGGANHQTDITLRVLEGGEVNSVGAHSPLTRNVVLRGGKIACNDGSRGSATAVNVEGIFTTATWKNVDFCRCLTVEPAEDGSESLVTVPNAHLAKAGYEAVIDVQEGATLRMTTQLWPAYNETGRSLRKVGRGTLILECPLNIGGEFRVEEGTLRLSNHAYLGSVASFRAAPGAKIVLDDGSILPTAPKMFGGGFLASAPVWFDATQIDVADNTSVSSVPNFGSAGGSFGAFFAGTAPGQPTFRKNGINGKPSLYFRGGGSGDALLLQSYTNHTDQATIYLVMKWDGWTDDDGGANYKWHGPISLVPRAMSGEDYNTVGACDIQWSAAFGGVNYAHGNGQVCSLGFEGTPTAANPLMFRLSRSGRSVVGGTWWSDESAAFKTQTTTLSSATPNYLIECVALGGRTTHSGGQCCASRSRMLKGWIGELIVFSRTLNDSEAAYVESYLKRKWFASAVEPVAAPEAAPAVVDVNVPADATAAVGLLEEGPEGEYRRVFRKTGAGTLKVAGPGAGYETLAAAEGVLHLNRSTAVASQAAVWIDMTDAETRTLDEDGVTVTSVRNKGSLGGALTRNPYKSSAAPTLCPLPKLALQGINGRAALEFDWNSALAMACPIAPVVPRQFYVFGVFQRLACEDRAGTGLYSAPFSCYSLAETKADQEGNSGFHYEERPDRVTFISPGYSSWYERTLGTAAFEPYVLSLYEQGRDCAFGQEVVSPENPTVATNCVWLLHKNGTPSTPMTVDWLQLGGRLEAAGRPQWYGEGNSNNRMWKGRIGEFILLDHQPSRDQIAEITAYLRKKWLGLGAGPATPPTFLTGGTEAVLGADKAVEVAQGAALEVEGAVQTVASLKLADGSTVRRTDEARGGAEPQIFDVAQLLEAEGTVTLDLPELETGANLVHYGTYSAPAQWTLVGPHASSRAVINAAQEKMLKIIGKGTLIVFR